MGGWMQKIRIMASKFDNPENEEDAKSTDWEEEDQDTKAMTLEKRNIMLNKIGV